MMPRTSALLVLIAGIVLILAFWLPSQSAAPQVCFKSGACLEVDVATSPEARQQGLMFRTELPENHGMVFVFEADGNHAFWMKNTLIPLDIIWLDAEKRIVGLKENAPPCLEDACPVFSVPEASRFVIEANNGFVAQNNIQVLQQASFWNVPT